MLVSFLNDNINVVIQNIYYSAKNNNNNNGTDGRAHARPTPQTIKIISTSSRLSNFQQVERNPTLRMGTSFAPSIWEELFLLIISELLL